MDKARVCLEMGLPCGIPRTACKKVTHKIIDNYVDIDLGLMIVRAWGTWNYGWWSGGGILRFGLDGGGGGGSLEPRNLYPSLRVILAEKRCPFWGIFLEKKKGQFFRIFGCMHGEHSKFWDILEKWTHV